MSGYITDIVVSAWNTIKSEFSKEDVTITGDLSKLEAEYLPAFHTFVTTQLSTIGSQALAILEQELATISAAFLNGGDVTAAISASVPTVLAAVTTDIAADLAAAKNAIYTAIGLKLATLSVPAT